MPIHRNIQENRPEAINDAIAKEKMRKHGNQSLHTATCKLKIGDMVLLEQIKTNKSSTTYETEPFVILALNGNQATIKRGSQCLKRNISLLKKYYTNEFFSQMPIHKK